MKPNTAFVTWPDDVAMSVGNAKNARYVSELPSSSRSLATGRAYAAPPPTTQGTRLPSSTCVAMAAIVLRVRIAVCWMNAKAAGLAQLVLVHQHALGPVDHLAGLEPTGGVGHLALERDRLAVASEGELDGRHQLGALERLHEVGLSAGVTRLLDEVALAERREDEHRGRAPIVDAAGGLDAVESGHLDVEDRDVGLEPLDERDGLVAPRGLADDLVPLLLQRLEQVEADDALVFGDDDPHRHDCSAKRRSSRLSWSASRRAIVATTSAR